MCGVDDFLDRSFEVVLILVKAGIDGTLNGVQASQQVERWLLVRGGRILEVS